jgi:hypothetical protein
MDEGDRGTSLLRSICKGKEMKREVGPDTEFRRELGLSTGVDQ